MGSTSSTDACAGAVRSHANTGSSSRFASSRELPTCAPTCSTSKRLSNDTAPQPLARKAARARSARACAAHRPSQPLGVRSLWHMAYARPCPKSDSSIRNLRSNWFPSMAAGTVTALSHAAARRRSRVADVARRIYHRRWRCIMRELRSAVRTGALILSIDLFSCGAADLVCRYTSSTQEGGRVSTSTAFDAHARARPASLMDAF